MIKTGKNHVAHPLSFADISIFDQKLEISVVLGSKEKKTAFSYKISDSFDFYWISERCFKGTLMQIWKSANIFVFIWK